MEITIVWPDGSLTTANGWKEAEQAIRAAQWGAYPSRRAFRKAMVKRALLWNGTHVSRKGSSCEFLQALARAQMFTLITEPFTDTCEETR